MELLERSVRGRPGLLAYPSIQKKVGCTLRNASFTRASVISPFFHIFSINAEFVSPLHVQAMLILNSRRCCVSRADVCLK